MILKGTLLEVPLQNVNFYAHLEVVFIIASKHFYVLFPFAYEYKHYISSTKKVTAS